VKRFEEKGAQVLSASTDSKHSQKMFAAGLGGITHPVLSDYHPKGQVSSAYGIYNDASGMSRRAAFVIDKEGIVRFSKVYSAGLPDVEELLAELDKLG